MIFKPATNNNWSMIFIFMSDEEAEFLDWYLQKDKEYCIDREDYDKLMEFRKRKILDRINKLKKV